MKFINLILILFFTIDYSQDLRVVYLFSSRPDSTLDKRLQNRMALEIQNNETVFYDLENFKDDSLYLENKKLEISDNLLDYIISKKKVDDFFDVKEILDGNRYIYKDFAKIDWKIISEQKRIDNYLATKALADFRGRKWEAWFTSDIPIPTGPYKFGGLQGLILEMKDTSNDYQFSFLGIQKNFEPRNNMASRIHYESSYNINREQFIKEVNLNKKDPARKFKALIYSGKIQLVDRNPEEIIKGIEKRAQENHINNPIELL